MMGRVTCADLAELRSAYLDGALRGADRDRVLTHLAGCESCRQDVDDLRRVRALLARPEAGPTPEDLSDRLLAIQDHSRTAGRRGPVVKGLATGLPGGLLRVRRRVTAAVLAVGLGAVAVGGLGLAAAPAQTLATVSDPRSEAAAEFGDVLAQLPFSNQAATALADLPATGVAAVPDSRPDSRARGAVLDPAQLRTLLSQVAQADGRISYRGRQDYFAARDGQLLAATLVVTNQPDHGTQIKAYDRSGRLVGTDARPAPTSSRLTDTATATLLSSSHAVSARTGATVRGRSAILLEARAPRATVTSTESPVLARWWVDAQTHLVLWQETYDGSGQLLLSTGFTSLDIGEVSATEASDQSQAATSRANASLTLSRADDLASAGWACSDQLAGLSLVRLRSDAAADPGVVHMVYSDGVDTVSVIEQRGQLDPVGSTWDPDLGAYVQRGSLTSASWQSGESVVTVVTDVPGELLRDVVTSLPHEPLRSPTTMERVVAGWARILGHR